MLVVFSGENLTVYCDVPGIKYLLLTNTVFWLLPVANWNTLISEIKPWFYKQSDVHLVSVTLCA